MRNTLDPTRGRHLVAAAAAVALACSALAWPAPGRAAQPATPAQHARELRQLGQLQQAQQALQAGDAAAALRLASPQLRAGPDPYRAGLIAARALQAQHHLGAAARLYHQLATRFPGDPELATQARALDAAHALDRADSALRSGDAIAALRLTQPVYASGADTYRAGWLMVHALLANHWKQRALRVLQALAQRYPHDTEIQRQLRSVRADIELDLADAALRAGDAHRAIALAQPVYDAGDAPYRSGWLLGRALARAGDTARAETVFASTAQRYPHDAELAMQPVLLLARMHDSPRAHEAFVALPAAGQHAVLRELGDAARWVYPNSLSVGGTLASSSGAMSGDDDAWLLYSHTGSKGTLALGLEHAHRFGRQAEAASIDYYRGLDDAYSLHLGASASPESSFLASRSLTAGLTRYLGGFSVESSVRWLQFTGTDATVLYGGVSWQALTDLHLRAGLYVSPTSGTYAVLLAPSWRDPWGSSFATLSAGNEADQIGVQGALQRVSSYTLRLGHTWTPRPDLAITADAFREHRSGLYDRTGIDLTLTRRW
jgi:YaiO family outer membrane protein